MKFRGTIQYVRPPDATAKAFKPALADGLAAAVSLWHDKFLSGHFTVEGGRRYGYQPRKGDDEPPRIAFTSKSGQTRMRSNPHYSWIKRRKFGHNRPLVWTGQSEQASKQIKITTTARSARGVLYALPRYMYQYRKDHNAPDKADELTRTVEDEVRTMALQTQKTIEEQFKRMPSAPTSMTVAA